MIKFFVAAIGFWLMAVNVPAQTKSRAAGKASRKKAGVQRQLVEARHGRQLAELRHGRTRIVTAHGHRTLSAAGRVKRVRLQEAQEAKLARAVATAASHSPEDLRFERQRGHLPWPVDSREVSMHFGVQPYADNLNLVYNNLGITIEVDGGAEVKSVFDGQVQSVMDVVDGMAVLVRHGKYISVYSNLSEAGVAAGDSVVAGQVLGKIAADGPLEFRIYNMKDVYMDPEKWLRQ